MRFCRHFHHTDFDGAVALTQKTVDNSKWAQYIRKPLVANVNLELFQYTEEARNVSE